MPPSSMGRALDAAAEDLARGLRRRLATDLRGALDRGEFSLHYQPRVALPDARVVGAEALLRWQHPRHGNVPPNSFIPLAEASDLILPLGAWVLREATREAAGWPPEAGSVSVNISARQVAAGVLSAQVEAALAESGLPPERLELELTESLALDAGEANRHMLGRLRDRGIGLALDDFGTGYGSLARLRRLPFSTLKLDRSFIGNLPDDAEDAAILRAVRAMAKALRLRLVAEGVERAEQRDFLQGIDCEEAQGWLFGRPVPAPALRASWQQKHGLAECAAAAMLAAGLPCPAAPYGALALPAP